MFDSLVRASDLATDNVTSQPRSAVALCSDAVAIISGSVAMISGYASTTVGCTVVRQFQDASAAPIPWVLLDNAPYLPDLASAGIETSRIIWIKTSGKDRVFETVDTLLSRGAFPFVCADLTDLSGITPGHFARCMHRCRRWNTTLLFLVLTPAASTPSPAIRVHIDVDSRDLSVLELRIRRSRIALTDGVCDVESPFPLS